MPNYKHFSDHDLLTAIQNHDDDAITYFYKQHWKTILNLVLTNSGSQEDARDLYQEGMLDFLENVWNGNFIPINDYKLERYFYSICKNKWLYHLRKQGTLKLVYVEDYPEGPMMETHPFEDPDRNEFSLPSSEQIKDIVMSFGDPCLSLLMGVHYEKRSMQQLAMKLNFKNADVAKQRKFICLKRLTKVIVKKFKII